MFHSSKYCVCVGWMFTRSKVLKGKYTHFSLGMLHWRSRWKVSFSIKVRGGGGGRRRTHGPNFNLILLSFTFDYTRTYPHFSFYFIFNYLFILFRPEKNTRSNPLSGSVFCEQVLHYMFWICVSGVFDSPLLGKVWQFCIIKLRTIIVQCVFVRSSLVAVHFDL